MKGIIEFFIGMVVLTLLALSATAYITASINTSNARSYHASIINEIEASNFNPGVLTGLYEDAREKGYELKPVRITNIDGRRSGEVTLGYTYSIGLLNITGEEHIIRGYAR